MSTDPAAEADRRLEEAVAREGARDPREFYRGRMRDLKQSDATAYEQAVAYYRDTLIPSVASGEADPLDAWTEYGRRLAEWTTPGHAVAIDPTGRATPWTPGSGRSSLVLHMPDGKGGRALLIGLPPEPTLAQRAAFDVLVEGKQKLRT